MKELLLKLSDSEFIKIIPDYGRDFKEIDYWKLRNYINGLRKKITPKIKTLNIFHTMNS